MAADLAVVALIYAIGLRLGTREDALRRTLLYAALFWPVAVAVGWYDALPAALLLLGVYWLLRRRPAAAGFASGLGFMTKVFPLVLVPVAVKFLPRWRERALACATALAVTVAIAAPLLRLSPTYFLASYRATLSRSAWETVWALLDGYYSYGKTPPLGVRFDPGTAGYVAYHSRVPGLPVALAFVALYAVLWLRPVAPTPRNLTLFSGISTVLFLLYSKGYSPQFIIYILPFVALLLPWPRAVGYAALLSVVNLLEWPIYHEWLGEVHWVLGAVVIARTLLWLAAGWEWLAELWGLRDPLRRLPRRTLPVAAVVALVLACPASVVAWRTWERAYYNGEELRPAFDFVRRYDAGPAPALVFTDDGLYQRFYPFFGARGDFYLFRPQDADGIVLKEPRLSPEGRRDLLDTLSRSHQQVFLVRKIDDWTSRDLNAWLADHAHLATSLRVESVDISLWEVPPQGPRAP